MSFTLREIEIICAASEINENDRNKHILSLSRFIHNAPNDFIEALISSPFGRVFKLFLTRCCNNISDNQSLNDEKNSLSQELRLLGVESGEGQKVFLALMMFYPPGSMQVEDAASKLPTWLYEIYENRYIKRESGTFTDNSINSEENSVDLRNRIFLNRMLGLSNLYYIDPEDQEILAELRDVRLKCVDLLIKTTNQELASAFIEDFGDRYWALAQSGVQHEELNIEECTKRDEVQEWLTHTPNSLKAEGGIQRFAAALLFSKPGSVKLANPDQNLPTWFIEGFKRYCSM